MLHGMIKDQTVSLLIGYMLYNICFLISICVVWVQFIHDLSVVVSTKTCWIATAVFILLKSWVVI